MLAQMDFLLFITHVPPIPKSISPVPRATIVIDLKCKGDCCLSSLKLNLSNLGFFFGLSLVLYCLKIARFAILKFRYLEVLTVCNVELPQILNSQRFKVPETLGHWL